MSLRVYIKSRILILCFVPISCFQVCSSLKHKYIVYWNLISDATGSLKIAHIPGLSTNNTFHNIFYDYMKSPKSSADISCSFLITNSQLIAMGQKGLSSVICKCQWVVAFLRAVIIPLSSVCFFPTFSISQLLCPSPGGFTVHCCHAALNTDIWRCVTRVQIYTLWTCSVAMWCCHIKALMCLCAWGTSLDIFTVDVALQDVEKTPST